MQQGIPTFDDGGATPDPQPGTSGTDNQPEQLGNLGGIPVSPSAIGGGQTVPGEEQLGNLGGAPVTPSGVGDKVRQLQDYISRRGAADQQTLQGVLQQNGGDPALAVDQSFKQDPQQGSAILKALAQNWDASRGSAAKAIAEGNLPLAASEGTKAFHNVPDGTNTMLTATKDGFKATVHTVDGQDSTYDLSPDQLNNVFKGGHGFFDHVIGAGTNKVLSAVQLAGGVKQGAANQQNAEAGGPPEGSQDMPQTGSHGENQIAGQQYPGKKAPEKIAPENQLVGPDISGMGQNAPPQAGPPLKKGAQIYDAQTGKTTQLPPGYTVVKDSDGGQHVLRPGEDFNPSNSLTYVKPSAQIYGMPGGQQGAEVTTMTPGGSDKFDISRGPITINRRGAQQTVGNAEPVEGASPQMQKLAQQIHPNNPQAQSQFIAGQLNEAQKQKNEIEIARSRGAEAAGVRGQSTENAATIRGQSTENAANIRAQGGVQQAQIKAQAVADGTDKRFEGEQGRDAANILKQMMHDNPGAPIGDQIKALREGNISDQLIRHLVNPSAPTPAPQRRQLQQPTTQQPAQGAPAAPTAALPAVALKSLQAGHITTFGNGQKWTVGPNGQPQQVQ